MAGIGLRNLRIVEQEIDSSSRRQSQKFSDSGIRNVRLHGKQAAESAESEIHGCDRQSEIDLLRGQNFTDVSGCGVRTLRITESETYSCVAGRLAE